MITHNWAISYSLCDRHNQSRRHNPNKSVTDVATIICALGCVTGIYTCIHIFCVRWKFSSTEKKKNDKNNNKLILKEYCQRCTKCPKKWANSQIKITIIKFILNIHKKYAKISGRSSTGSVRFVWVPSHFGVEGNEVADKLAKEASKAISAEEGNVPFTYFGELFKKQVRKNTNNENKEEGKQKGIIYFDNYYMDNKNLGLSVKNSPAASLCGWTEHARPIIIWRHRWRVWTLWTTIGADVGLRRT